MRDVRTHGSRRRRSGSESDQAKNVRSSINIKPLFKLMVDKRASDLFFTSVRADQDQDRRQDHAGQQADADAEDGAPGGHGLMTQEQIEEFNASSKSTSRSPSRASAASASTSSISAATSAMVLRYITPRCRGSRNSACRSILKELIMLRRGLILMVGATGSGKSTTLAAMINHRNEKTSSTHHHDRGPDRVPAPEQEVDRQPARSRSGHQVLCAGAEERRCARRRTCC